MAWDAYGSGTRTVSALSDQFPLGGATKCVKCQEFVHSAKLQNTKSWTSTWLQPNPLLNFDDLCHSHVPLATGSRPSLSPRTKLPSPRQHVIRRCLGTLSSPSSWESCRRPLNSNSAGISSSLLARQNQAHFIFIINDVTHPKTGLLQA